MRESILLPGGEGGSTVYPPPRRVFEEESWRGALFEPAYKSATVARGPLEPIQTVHRRVTVWIALRTARDIPHFSTVETERVFAVFEALCGYDEDAAWVLTPWDREVADGAPLLLPIAVKMVFFLLLGVGRSRRAHRRRPDCSSTWRNVPVPAVYWR